MTRAVFHDDYRRNVVLRAETTTSSTAGSTLFILTVISRLNRNDRVGVNRCDG
jgi:hypothetical protein